MSQQYFCADPNHIRELRPFYWLLTLAFGLFYVSALSSSSLLGDNTRLVVFTLFMILQTSLHWVGPYTSGTRWLFPYLVLQAGLVFATNLVSVNWGIALIGYLGLAGEIVGVMEGARRALLALALLLVLSLLNEGLIWGWHTGPNWLVSLLPLAFFVIVTMDMFVRQACERDRAEKLVQELEKVQRQLAEYAVRIEDLTLAGERQRMARELHDTLAQGIVGLILQLEALQAHLARGDSDKAKLIVAQAQDRARGTLAQARRAIDDLRQAPASAALSEWTRLEAERFSSATAIPCSLELEPITLSSPAADHAMRFVSEALTNVARHARAQHTAIRIECANQTVTIRVQDDGIGFDPEQVIGQTGHYGLLGMRERARLAGGTLEIQSATGTGTACILSLPIVEQFSESGQLILAPVQGEA